MDTYVIAMEMYSKLGTSTPYDRHAHVMDTLRWRLENIYQDLVEQFHIGYAEADVLDVTVRVDRVPSEEETDKALIEKVMAIVESTYAHDEETGRRIDMGSSPVSGADVVDALLELEDQLKASVDRESISWRR